MKYFASVFQICLQRIVNLSLYISINKFFSRYDIFVLRQEQCMEHGEKDQEVLRLKMEVSSLCSLQKTYRYMSICFQSLWGGGLCKTHFLLTHRVSDYSTHLSQSSVKLHLNVMMLYSV